MSGHDCFKHKSVCCRNSFAWRTHLSDLFGIYFFSYFPWLTLFVDTASVSGCWFSCPSCRDKRLYESWCLACVIYHLDLQISSGKLCVILFSAAVYGASKASWHWSSKIAEIAIINKRINLQLQLRGQTEMDKKTPSIIIKHWLLTRTIWPGGKVDIFLFPSFSSETINKN